MARNILDKSPEKFRSYSQTRYNFIYYQNLVCLFIIRAVCLVFFSILQVNYEILDQ